MYWIEHVLKYKGAPHLKSAGVRLGWIQFNLLDVIGFIGTTVFVVLFVSYYTAKKVCISVKRVLSKDRKIKLN